MCSLGGAGGRGEGVDVMGEVPMVEVAVAVQPPTSRAAQRISFSIHCAILAPKPFSPAARGVFPSHIGGIYFPAETDFMTYARSGPSRYICFRRSRTAARNTKETRTMRVIALWAMGVPLGTIILLKVLHFI